MILGIDIGGTTIKIGLIDNNKIVRKYTIKTNSETIIDDLIKSFVINKINVNQIDAIGCALPGFIDHKNGVVTLSGNLGYKNYQFKKIFEEKLKKPVFVVNDANAAALGEYWVGAGSKYDSTILYTLGTGLGGGIIINNQLVFGSSGYAGELGHGGNFQNERNCTCGLSNCLEPFASATGIEKSLKEFLGKDISLKDSVELFLKNDSNVINAFTKSLTPLANHIAIMETSLNPDCIIIGGGPSNIGKPLADFIKKLVDKSQLGFISNKTPILIATTRNDAGILGAAYWAITESTKLV
ncbi:MAG: ROK family protein [Mycoplasmatales bacterium]|nr:ROK family protein [Mycoplasmatales bacterium]